MPDEVTQNWNLNKGTLNDGFVTGYRWLGSGLACRELSLWLERLQNQKHLKVNMNNISKSCKISNTQKLQFLETKTHTFSCFHSRTKKQSLPAMRWLRPASSASWFAEQSHEKNAKTLSVKMGKNDSIKPYKAQITSGKIYLVSSHHRNYDQFSEPFLVDLPDQPPWFLAVYSKKVVTSLTVRSTVMKVDKRRFLRCSWEKRGASPSWQLLWVASTPGKCQHEKHGSCSQAMTYSISHKRWPVEPSFYMFLRLYTALTEKDRFTIHLEPQTWLKVAEPFMTTGADQPKTRLNILRYFEAISLSGMLALSHFQDLQWGRKS